MYSLFGEYKMSVFIHALFALYVHFIYYLYLIVGYYSQGAVKMYKPNLSHPDEPAELIQILQR